MRTAENKFSPLWRHDCIIKNESAKCTWSLIQSTRDSYVSLLKDIGLVTFERLE
jgi:hypothetical protein